VSGQIWPVLLIIAAIIVYVVAKVIFYARKSANQWKEVDQSKLKHFFDLFRYVVPLCASKDRNIVLAVTLSRYGYFYRADP
jgi:O-antigen/teichoic acid export membrane protein